jgi:hypothetical protein
VDFDPQNDARKKVRVTMTFITSINIEYRVGTRPQDATDYFARILGKLLARIQKLAPDRQIEAFNSAQHVSTALNMLNLFVQAQPRLSELVEPTIERQLADSKS